jgi:hypothetical protein
MLNRYLDTPLRKVVALVAFLNLAYFGIEFAVALTIAAINLDAAKEVWEAVREEHKATAGMRQT